MWPLVLVPLLILIIMLAGCEARTAALTVSWDAPTTNTDGSPLTDLAGYNVYINGTQVGTTQEVSFPVTLGNGSQCATVTAIDTNGNESAQSAAACIDIDELAPNPPDNVRIL